MEEDAVAAGDRGRVVAGAVEADQADIEQIRLTSGTTIDNNWVLTFFWELPLDKVALGDLLATENPLVLEAERLHG